MQIHSNFTIPQPEMDIRTKTCDNGLVFGACRLNRVSCIGSNEEQVRIAIRDSIISNHHAKLKRLQP